MVICSFFVSSPTFMILTLTFYSDFSSWKIIQDECSSQCGSGVAKQYISCLLTNKKGSKEIDIAHCERLSTEIGPRPRAVVPCNGTCYQARWVYSKWTEVNKLVLFIGFKHIIPAFNDPKEEGFGKHCGKMLVTSIFSFSHSVFYSIKERNHHFSNI